MKVLEAEFLKDFLAMCEDAWNLGWHEYHAGNLTYRMKQEETDAVREELSEDGAWKRLPVKVPSLAEEFFLVTANTRGKLFSRDYQEGRKADRHSSDQFSRRCLPGMLGA